MFLSFTDLALPFAGRLKLDSLVLVVFSVCKLAELSCFIIVWSCNSIRQSRTKCL